MTSKEKIKKLDYTLIINLNEKDFMIWNSIKRDLEILEEIRDYIKVIDYGEEFQNRYALQVGYPYPAGTIIQINKELYLKWSRWLNEE